MKKIVISIIAVVMVLGIGVVVALESNLFLDKSYALVKGEQAVKRVGNTEIYDSNVNLILYEQEYAIKYYAENYPDIDISDMENKETTLNNIARTEALYQDAVKNGFDYTQEEAEQAYKNCFVTGDDYLQETKEESLYIAKMAKQNAIDKLGITEEQYVKYRTMLLGKSIAVSKARNAFLRECIDEKGMTPEEASKEYTQYSNDIMDKIKQTD